MINSFLIWLTEIAESSFIITLSVSLLNLGYLSEGFLVMQHALDKAIMRYHDLTAAQALLGDVNVFVQRFPYPEYYHDYFFNFLGILIPLVILFIFSMNHFTLVQSLVDIENAKCVFYLLQVRDGLPSSAKPVCSEEPFCYALGWLLQ